MYTICVYTVGLEKFTSMKSSRLSRADRDRENIIRELFQFYSLGMNFNTVPREYLICEMFT